MVTDGSYTYGEYNITETRLITALYIWNECNTVCQLYWNFKKLNHYYSKFHVLCILLQQQQQNNKLRLERWKCKADKEGGHKETSRQGNGICSLAWSLSIMRRRKKKRPVPLEGGVGRRQGIGWQMRLGGSYSWNQSATEPHRPNQRNIPWIPAAPALMGTLNSFWW